MSPSSHSCGGTDAEEAQPVSQHLSGGIIQGQPGVVHRLEGLSPCGVTRAESYHR
jgi:hypothetical protein